MLYISEVSNEVFFQIYHKRERTEVLKERKSVSFNRCNYKHEIRTAPFSAFAVHIKCTVDSLLNRIALYQDGKSK